MTRTPHILIVEDDREIATLVSRFLRNNDFRIRAVPNGREMDVALRDGRFDLIVLDLMLPGEDGLSLCRRLRNDGSIPIIMLTAKGEEIDRILGLEMGADDYLVKPFNPRELLARIRAVLRRAGSTPQPEVGESSVLAFAGWRLDKAVRRLLNPAGERVVLTGAEIDLLLAFCERPRRVLSRDQLLDLTQGRAAAPFERSIDVLRLRADEIADDRQRRAIVADLALMERMVGGALSYLREGRASGSMAATDIPALLQTICDDFADLGHIVVFEGPMRASALCDADQMTRAVTNLVDNAIKFGGKVVVRLDDSEPDVIAVLVEDDGPGIAPEEREKVFEPFYRSDLARTLKQGSGFGLGLAIVRAIAEAHRGELTLAERQGGGLSARITWPRRR